jgi:hypothetical protein
VVVLVGVAVVVIVVVVVVVVGVAVRHCHSSAAVTKSGSNWASFQQRDAICNSKSAPENLTVSIRMFLSLTNKIFTTACCGEQADNPFLARETVLSQRREITCRVRAVF